MCVLWAKCSSDVCNCRSSASVPTAARWCTATRFLRDWAAQTRHATRSSSLRPTATHCAGRVRAAATCWRSTAARWRPPTSTAWWWHAPSASSTGASRAMRRGMRAWSAPSSSAVTSCWSLGHTSSTTAKPTHRSAPSARYAATCRMVWYTTRV